MKKMRIFLLLLTATLLLTACGTPKKEMPVNEQGELAYRLLTDGSGYAVSRGTYNETSVVIPAEHEGLPVLVVEPNGFRDSALTTVKFLGGVVTIKKDAFRGCDKLTTVFLPNTLVTVEENAFAECTALAELEIPDSVTALEEGAFGGCSALTTVTIRAALLEQSMGAFEGTPYLDRAGTWENGVRYMGELLVAIDEERMGESVTVRAGTTAIADGAFKNCQKLTSITVNEGMEIIGKEAFSGCSNLAQVSLPDSIRRIGNDAFANTALTRDQSWWKTGMLYVDNCLIRIFVSPNYCETDVLAVRQGTVCIATGAVSAAQGVKTLTLPASLRSVDGYTLYRANELTEISVSSDNPTYTSVDGVLYTKDLVTAVACPTDKTGGVRLPETVEVIEPYAFAGTLLEYVVLPASLKSMGEHAFAFYINGLDLFYEGDKEAYALVTYDSMTTFLQTNKTLYARARWEYVDGVPTPKT